MSEPNFDFYFELAGRAGAQGAIAPAEQFFEGSIAEVSLAREIGQNSIDARAGDGPVVLQFELAEMNTRDVPGIATLTRHLRWVADETAGSEGHARMVSAYEVVQQDTIAVLRISDFGTTGLRGSESRDSNKSKLSALTRGAGISANDGTRGGSFGIGSAVGPMSSGMCTVLYTSLPDDRDEVVFAGYSRLASHRDEAGAWRNAEGFYTDLTNGDDFVYLRDPGPIGPFEPRTAAGTDIYILAYRKAEEDPRLENLRDAFISNFMMAIHRGHLEVEGLGGGGSWRLDRENLRSQVQRSPEARAFYEAINDPQPVLAESSRFGAMALYIHVDDSLERSLHTLTLRAPLMKIDTFRHSSIPAKYAAVLECSDDAGNQLLRSLEPPQHDRWDPGRAPEGGAALRELKQFVRDGLRSRVKEQLGETVEIKGLSKLLPARDLTVATRGIGNAPSEGEGDDVEAATVQGKPGGESSAAMATKRAVKVTVQRPAVSGGEALISKGKDRGGKGRRSDGSPRIPSTGGEGSGKSRIARGQVEFRSWTSRGSASLTVALASPSELEGDLELVAIGAGGAVEEEYVLPITSVELVDTDESPLSWKDNVISGVVLKPGATTFLNITLEGDRRYRLDIK